MRRHRSPLAGIGGTADDDDCRHQRFEAADVTGGGEQIDRRTAARHGGEHLFRDIGGAPERQATGFDVQRGCCRAQPFIESLVCNLLQPAVVERQLRDRAA